MNRYYRKLGEIERELELQETERQEKRRFEEEMKKVLPLLMLASLPMEAGGRFRGRLRRPGEESRGGTSKFGIGTLLSGFLPSWAQGFLGSSGPHSGPHSGFLGGFGNLVGGMSPIVGIAKMGLRAFGFGRQWPNVEIDIKLTPKEAKVAGIRTKDIGGPGKASPTAKWYKNFAYSVGSPFAKTAGLLGVQLPALRLSTAAGRKDMDVLSEKAKATTFYNIYNKWAVPIARKVGLNIPKWKTGERAIGPYTGGKFGGIRYNWEFDKDALREANKRAFATIESVAEAVASKLQRGLLGEAY